MRMTLYYMLHAVKNQIRKLFRTWVAVFLLVCLVIGLLFGIGAAALSSLFEDAPDEGYVEELPPENEEQIDEETLVQVIELGVGGIVLVALVFSLLMADKSGSSIFLMADVNLLFCAPLRPQTVLLFRLIMQAGATLAATVYLVFQIPNLVINLGLSLVMVLVIFAAFLLLAIYAKLLSVLFFTVSSTHPSFKKHLRTGIYALLALLAGAFVVYARPFGRDYLAAATGFFNAPITRAIPVWGWLKGFVLFAFEKQVGKCLASLGALLLVAVALALVIRRIKADFYEDALAHSEKTAELQRAAQEARGVKTRKKDRSERLSRDGLSKGLGASVYFHKALYNRFRFAHLGLFTKTAETYFVVALGVSGIMVLGLRTSFFPAVALVLAGFVFFRALGNPISEDVRLDSFFLVPDTAHRKVFFSFAAGMLSSLLDLLPAFLVSALLLRANPLHALLWLGLILSMGAYADSVGLFIDLSLSTGLSQMLKSLVQMLFLYFGLAPTAVLVILGFAFDRLLLFSLLALLFNLLITALSLALSPLFVERGRK